MTQVAAHVRGRSGLALAGALLGVSLVLAGCGEGGGGGGAQPVSSTQKELYKQAEQAGGKVNVFIGTASNTEIDALVATFNEDFPNIKVSYISGTGDDISERFLTEKRSGLSNADVIALAGLSAFKRIDKEGFLEAYEPEDVNLFTKDKGSYIDKKAYSFSNLFNSACYNPTNVSKEEAALLESYKGWTDPAWKGRAAIVNVDGFGYRFGMTQWVYGDPSLGKPWLADLAQLEPTVYTSANTAVPQVIAGEHDVVFNALTVYGARADREGAPLRCVTGEYQPYYSFASALAAKAPNAAGGKLFINWLYSARGQKAVQDTLSWSARRDGFDTPVIKADWWNEPTDPRLVQEDVVDKNYDDLLATFNDEMGKAKE